LDIGFCHAKSFEKNSRRQRERQVAKKSFRGFAHKQFLLMHMLKTDTNMLKTDTNCVGLNQDYLRRFFSDQSHLVLPSQDYYRLFRQIL